MQVRRIAIVGAGGPSTAFPRLLPPGEAHCRSLGCARDDKGRVITHLKVCELDREFFYAIRL
jgi:hypothetical protein